MTLISRVQAREGEDVGEPGLQLQREANMTSTLVHAHAHTRTIESTESNAGCELKRRSL